MTLRGNLHCHSTFSDGENTMEEMVLAAIGKGFAYLGFSEHGWALYDSGCCIKKESILAYFAEVKRLQSKYNGQIELYAGFENDYYSLYPKEKQDFAIGSVHYLLDEASGEYHTIDYEHNMFEDALNRTAGGDIRRLVASYYGLVADLAERYRPDIIGHLDLITKLNGGGRYFDESSDWYRRAVTEACERIAATGCIVEVNTGAIAKGYRIEPYPSRWILSLLNDLSVPVTVSSDAHSADTLDFWFDRAEGYLRECGIRSVKQMSCGRWIDIPMEVTSTGPEHPR